FHTRSINSSNVAQEIRYGTHKNAVCRFDNIIKLLPHLSVNNLNMKECQENVNYEEMNENSSHHNSSTTLNLREYSIPYVDYKDAPVLLDFINLFGKLSGFDRLKSRLLTLDNNDEEPQQQQQNAEKDKKGQEQRSTDRTEHLSLSLIYAYLQPFALCCYFLNDSVIEEYFQPIVNTVLNYLPRISDDQIKKESKKGARYDFIAGLKLTLYILLKRMPSSKEEDIERAEILCFGLIYRFFQVGRSCSSCLLFITFLLNWLMLTLLYPPSRGDPSRLNYQLIYECRVQVVLHLFQPDRQNAYWSRVLPTCLDRSMWLS
ncbi:unnamed protein product, partial [Trichobilharzia regenti]